MSGNQKFLSELEELQCPFTWKIPQENSKITLQKAELRAAQDRREKGRIQQTATALTLCYEYANRGELDKAFNLLEELESINSKATLETEFESPVNEFESSQEFSLSEAYKHVKFASKCFLLFKAERLLEAEDTIMKITPFKNMSNGDQAIVYWLQSDMKKDYGHKGFQEAIPCIEKALELSPHLFILHYQMGRILGRIRRVERTDLPDFREIFFLETALQKTGDPKIMVMLAQTYRDKATLLYFSEAYIAQNKRQQIKELNQKSSDLYRLVLNIKKRPVALNVRCADGLMRLPPPWKNLEKAKECIDQALAVRSDDQMLNQTAGTYYRLKGDLEKAKHYLMLASNNMTINFAACMDLVRIKKQENYNYNPIADLEKFLTYFEDQPYIEDILCTLGVIYFFEKKEFKEALKFWSRVIEKNIGSKKMKVYFNNTFKIRSAININKIIVTEIQKLKKEGSCSEDEKKIYDKLVTSFPDLLLDNSEGL